MILDSDIKLDFSDVLIRPKRSTLESRSQVNLYRDFTSRWAKRKIHTVPIIAANMATGTFSMAHTFSKYGLSVAIHKFHSLAQWQDQLKDKASLVLLDSIWFCLGMSEDELDLYREIRKHLAQIDPEVPDCLKVCVDIANGYSQTFAGFIHRIREEFPGIILAAGNVASPEMVQELIINGADYVKVGIGPGSQCTTRLKTGIGYPQISAAIECSDAAHGLGAGIILDGGMRSPGDVAKAFCANSDFVMLGGLFAGTDECEGEIISRYYQTNELEEKDGELKPKIITKQFKLFYGMSSEYAQNRHGSGMKEYRASEGRTEEVPLIGPVEPIVQDILGGLRSSGTYIGAKELKHFGLCATLVRVSRQHDRF